VERQADPNSRRSFRIYLTEKGRGLRETLIPIPMQINQDLLSRLDSNERDDMIRLLQKMVADL
jgi:DNA-binding MarR family transcriptional regulator